MSTQYERELRARLLAAEVRLALADRADVLKTARYDLSRRLIELGADVRADGSILFETGDDLDHALARLRANDGAHLFADVVAPVAKADLSGLTASQKLTLSNEGGL